MSDSLIAGASVAGLGSIQLFAQGVASGDPYADSVILWTRISPLDALAASADVRWQISTSADFAPGSIVGSGVFTTSVARDWTVKVEAKSLKADSAYYYRFLVGDSVSTVGQTRTLPVGSEPVRLAVFSCANYPAADQFAAYGRAVAINALNPYDAWVHLGDYIYEYGPGGYGEAEDAAGTRGFLPNREIVSLSDYRQRYAQYHSDANLQALRAAAPLIAIWDDHETANDSWSGGAQNHQPASEGDWIARRDAALQAYYEWMPIREPGLRQPSDGATTSSPLSQGYRSFNFGDVLALHVLETRLTARDQQLSYPDAAAVQARIGAILADPAQTVAYATRLGLTPPASADALPAFAQALAPAVTQELVIATVQKAWGDPERDLIGDTQMAWLQQQMGSSSAAWQVLGQQVLMQSMAVPAELLLNAGNPALLDKYAAPLQKLATGTPFASLTSAEQALFAEAGKIPYNLDAWDGYGVERETILQTALALGKKLISLAGDTHNAWAGVLDTMSAGIAPAGTVAGVEFATPGVTSPGFEKYLPGADAYIRARYPALDGLDGLFMGYINGLKYADVNRRGFLDLTVTPEQASGSFQLLDGLDPVSGAPVWNSETVVANRSFSLAVGSEASPLIAWQAGWRELDLVFGMAVDAAGNTQLLDPASYAVVPRDGVQLPDVTVSGSADSDRIVVAAGSSVDAGGGADQLFNIDSLGGNLLVGGKGADRFLLRAASDRVIGGTLFADAARLGLQEPLALVDRAPDTFLIDSSDPASGGTLQILDFEPGIDGLLLDGAVQIAPWSDLRQRLAGLGVAINAAPVLQSDSLQLNVQPGVDLVRDLLAMASDPDGDPLRLVVLQGPDWIRSDGTALHVTAPTSFTAAQFADLALKLAFSDGRAMVDFTPQLKLLAPPPVIALSPLQADQAEGTTGSTAFRFLISRSGDLASASTADWQVGGSATASATADDFGGTFPSGQIAFAAGESSRTLTLTVSADSLVEPDEGFTLSLSAANGATLDPQASQAQAVIRNDDTSVSLSAVPLAVREDSGEALAYVFSRQGLSRDPLQVNFTVAGTASSSGTDADFSLSGASALVANSGTILFAANSTTSTLILQPRSDNRVEPNETVSIDLADGAGYTVAALSGGLATGTILDDDSLISLSVSPASIQEDGGVPLLYSFSRTGSVDLPLTVRFAVAGSAAAGTDYSSSGALSFDATSGSVRFQAGVSSLTLTIAAAADSIVEADESVVLSLLDGAGYSLASAVAVSAVIRDDDASVSLALSPESVDEDGNTNLTYVFSRSGATSAALAVAFQVGGTAAFATDYTQSGAASFTASSGRLFFAPGSSVATLLIDPSADEVVEPNETVLIALSPGAGYQPLTTAALTGMIRNDDPSVSLSLLAPAVVAEDGTAALRYVFSRNGLTTASLSVSYSVAGTATLGADYTGIAAAGITKTLVFAAGSATATLTVDPTADAAVEPDETVALALVAGSGYFIATPDPVVGTIANDDATVTLSLQPPTTVLEDGSTNLVYVFERSGSSEAALNVNYTVGGTATLATDYSGIASSGSTKTLRFEAGVSRVSLVVDPVADTVVEGNETVVLTLASGSGYGIGTSAAVSGTIIDDDATVTLSVSPGSVLEDGVGNLVYTFTRTGYSAAALTVSYAVGGSASYGVDYGVSGASSYGLSSGTVTFAAGALSTSVVVDPTADPEAEDNETVLLSLVGGSGYVIGTAASASGTIRNDDTNVSIAASTGDKLEGASGTTTGFLFTVSRSGLTTGTSRASWSVSGNGENGADGADFSGGVLPSGTVSFGPGVTVQMITVSVKGDNTVEADNGFLVTLAGLSGATLGAAASASGLIRNDDTNVEISALAAERAEGDSGTTPFTFLLSRSGVTSGVSSVNWKVSGGSGVNPAEASDFAAGVFPSGSVSFAAGVTSTTITVGVKGDTTTEPDNPFQLSLSNAVGATLVNSVVSGVIRNDDTNYAITATDAVKAEGSSGSTGYRFAVSRSGVTSGASSVNWTVSGIGGASAADAGDFGGTLPSGTVSFASGETVQTITVSVSGDSTAEADEGFQVSLSGASSGVITTASASGTIRNDDLPEISVSAPVLSVLEDGSENLRFLFARTGPTTAALTVNYTLGGSAMVGTDYSGIATGSGASRTVQFSAGASMVTVTVDPTADSTVENDETVSVTVAAGSGYRLGSSAASTGTIRNDDSTVTLSLPVASVLEDGSDNLVYVFRRTGYLEPALSVNYLVGGTATLGMDYSGIASAGTVKTIRLAAGAETVSLVIDPTADNTVEVNETVALTLVAGSGYSIGTSAAVSGTIMNDDATVSVAVSPASVAEDGSPNLVYTFTRTGYSGSALTVNYGVGGSAGYGLDYSVSGTTSFGSTSGTVTFEAGLLRTSLVVDPTADTAVEGNETVVLTLVAGMGYAIGSGGSASGTISNDDVIGTDAADTLRGGALAELIDGLGGRDTLSGGAGADSFRFRFGQSSISAPDRVTDFAFGTDRISILAADGTATSPVSLSRAANNSVATTLSQLAAAVFADADGAQSGSQPLLPNAAALVVSSQASIAGLYLLINDPNDTRSDSADLMINLTGYTGTLPAFGAITPLSQLFAIS